MLDTRANEWLSRLQANGPKVVSLVFAALILLQLLQIGFSMFATPVRSPQPVATGFVPQRPRAEIDIPKIVASNPFGTPAGASQDPDSAPRSTANLLLAGTIATEDPRRGVAIISDAGAPSKVYSVGERIGSASLHSVYLDRVILDRGGALETLVLPRQLPPNRPTTAAAQRPADARTGAAVDNIRRLVQQDPNILDQVMRTVPSFDNAAGKLRGFRAYPGRNRQIFSKLGLKAGDLVTAINGTPLDDPQRSQDVFNTIQTSDHVTVTIERGGQKQDLSLNIAQVAAQATKELEGGEANSGTTPAASPNGLAPPANAPPANAPPANAPPANAPPANAQPPNVPPPTSNENTNE
jgi:general secretion pathway protein C